MSKKYPVYKNCSLSDKNIYGIWEKLNYRRKFLSGIEKAAFTGYIQPESVITQAYLMVGVFPKTPLTAGCSWSYYTFSNGK